MNDYLHILEKNKLFSGLSSTEMTSLMHFISSRSYDVGQHICVEGDVAEEIYIVAEGEVKVSKEDRVIQSDHSIAILPPGALVGELSFLTHQPRSATVTALTPATLLILSFKDLAHLKESSVVSEQFVYYKIVENIANGLSYRLAETTQFVCELLHNKKIEKEVQTAKSSIFAGLFSI